MDQMQIKCRYIVLLLGFVFIIACVSASDSEPNPSTTPDYKDGYLVLIGGGGEKDLDGSSWSDKLYSLIVSKIGNGRIGILSIETQTTWLSNYFKKLGAADVVDIKVDNRSTANSDNIYKLISECKAIFIKGGDQYKYYQLWNDTQTEDAIEYVYKTGGVVAGTSAGAMILSNIVFTAQNGSLYPEEAISDPFHTNLSLKDDFINLIPDFLVDTHFTQRGRLARLLVMIARWDNDNKNNILGIGIDDNTGFFINPDKTGEIIGEGSVSIVYKSDKSEFYIQHNQAPVFTEVSYCQMTENYKFSLIDRTIIQVPDYAITVENVPERIPLNIDDIINGSKTEDMQKGSLILKNIKKKSAVYYGLLEKESLLGGIPNSIIFTNTFDIPDLIENYFGGGTFLLYSHPGSFVLWLDKTATVEIKSPGIISTKNSSSDSSSILILDSYPVKSISHSRYIADEKVSLKKRQSVGLVSGKVHLIAKGWNYDFINRVIIK